MFNDPESFHHRAVSVNRLVTGLLIGGILASPVALASGEERHEVQDAEARHEVQDVEGRHEVQDADSRREVQDVEPRREVP